MSIIKLLVPQMIAAAAVTALVSAAVARHGLVKWGPKVLDDSFFAKLRMSKLSA